MRRPEPAPSNSAWKRSIGGTLKRDARSRWSSTTAPPLQSAGPGRPEETWPPRLHVLPLAATARS